MNVINFYDLNEQYEKIFIYLLAADEFNDFGQLVVLVSDQATHNLFFGSLWLDMFWFFFLPSYERAKWKDLIIINIWIYNEYK